jgi:hypothetical protein
MYNLICNWFAFHSEKSHVDGSNCLTFVPHIICRSTPIWETT